MSEKDEKFLNPFAAGRSGEASTVQGMIKMLANSEQLKGRRLSRKDVRTLAKRLKGSGFSNERALGIVKGLNRKLGGDDSSLATRHRGRQDRSRSAEVSPAALAAGTDLAERFASDPRQAQREKAALMKISKGRDAPLSEREASAVRFNPGVQYRAAMMDETSSQERQMRPEDWQYQNPATDGTLPVVPYDEGQMQAGRYLGNLPRALRKSQDFEAAIMLSQNTDPANPFAGGNPNDIVKSLSGDQGRYIFEQLFNFPIENIRHTGAHSSAMREAAGQHRKVKGAQAIGMRRFDTQDLRRD